VQGGDKARQARIRYLFRFGKLELAMEKIRFTEPSPSGLSDPLGRTRRHDEFFLLVIRIAQSSHFHLSLQSASNLKHRKNSGTEHRSVRRSRSFIDQSLVPAYVCIRDLHELFVQKKKEGKKRAL